MMGATVKEYGDWVRSQLGVHESPWGSNHQPYSAVLGRPAEPWCADFLVAGARHVGLPLPSESASTSIMARAFQDAGRYGQHPRVGSFCFIYHPELGRIGHVCWVEAVNPDGSVTTINGNSNLTGGRTGGLVCRNIRRSNIDGYGYPAYTAAPIVVPKPKPEAWPLLELGSDGAAVADLQRALNAAGATPRLRVDGAFGPLTVRAVKDFQMRKHLEVDGIVGPRTRAAFAN